MRKTFGFMAGLLASIALVTACEKDRADGTRSDGTNPPSGRTKRGSPRVTGYSFRDAGVYGRGNQQPDEGPERRHIELHDPRQCGRGNRLHPRQRRHGEPHDPRQYGGGNRLHPRHRRLDPGQYDPR
jgi:hypothetical protein